MGVFNRTSDIIFLPHQEVMRPGTAIGTTQTFASELALHISFYHAPVAETANTDPGTFLLQTSPSSSGNEDWTTVARFRADTGTAASETLSAGASAGATSISLASTAGFTAGDGLYIRDTGVTADGEWAMARFITTDTSIELIDGLTNAKDTADIVYNQAEVFHWANIIIPSRWRVIFEYESASGPSAAHVKAIGSTIDDFT